jgi:hypothetical protein
MLVHNGGVRKLLFVYDLDLLVDYLPREPVNRHMHPVALLAPSTMKAATFHQQAVRPRQHIARESKHSELEAATTVNSLD